MPEIDTRSTQERNFQIEKTSNNTYVVRSDSERFGKNEITYESPNREDCLEYIAQRRPERQFRFYIIGYTEAILESQFTYVIVTLQPDYAVDYAIYDNVTAELMGTSRLPRTDYLSFEEAARAALNEPSASLKRHDLSVRDSLLEAVEEFPKKRAVPVYLHTAEQAYQRGEIEQYGKPRLLNAELRQTLPVLFRKYYDGMTVNQKIVRALFAKFGQERASAVLANM